jgi:hypothetical protein
LLAFLAGWLSGACKAEETLLPAAPPNGFDFV